MHTPPAARPRLVPLVLIGGGMLALAAGVVVGGDATAAGAVAFLCACALALGEATRSIVTWPNAVLAFVAVIWFVPIRLYSLPVTLPFELELYRLLILLMVLAFVMSAIQTGREVDAVGAGKPLYALALAALTSQAIHTNDLAASGTQSQALKSLSFFLSFVVIFLLVASTIDSVRDVDRSSCRPRYRRCRRLARSPLRGPHPLQRFRPPRRVPAARATSARSPRCAGRLRVHSSAQHPIALGAALIMVVPLAMYLAQKAARGPKAIFWNVAGGDSPGRRHRHDLPHRSGHGHRDADPRCLVAAEDPAEGAAGAARHPDRGARRCTRRTRRLAHSFGIGAASR